MPVLIEAEHALACNKVILIDGEIVIAGTFNFSTAAEERNAESLRASRGERVADRYW